MKVLIYTFRTSPFTAELEEQFGQKPFIFGRLKEDLEKFKKLIDETQPELIIGFAKSPYKYSLIEAKAINRFNKSKSIVKNGVAEYKLHLPEQIPTGMKVRQEGTDSFCNWTMYKLAAYVEDSKLTFIHLGTDLLESDRPYLQLFPQVGFPQVSS